MSVKNICIIKMVCAFAMSIIEIIIAIFYFWK